MYACVGVHGCVSMCVGGVTFKVFACLCKVIAQFPVSSKGGRHCFIVH